jgi:GTP-binding protein LepA
MNMDKNIRNFAIIAHIDHGKSTLADRFLEVTKTIPKDKLKEQFLDQSPISRERGITIKLAPVRMLWHPQARNSKLEIRNKSEISSFAKASADTQNPNDREIGNWKLEIGNSSSDYMMNLIDTPGHIDFSYEVSRTLAACEGAILLVDATQGVQAQTVAHLNVAKKLGLKIIPAINKVDLASAKPESVAKEIEDFFGFPKEEMLFVSAKSGLNVESLLAEVIKQIPSPKGDTNSPLKALVFDAVYDEHRGVVAFVRIIDGSIKKGDKIRFFQTGAESEVGQVGYFSPFLTPLEQISAGEIGYVITGIKDLRLCRVGDTITHSASLRASSSQVSDFTPLPGYQPPKPMVFYGVYPHDKNELVALKEALGKISLSDSALTISNEYSAYLGSGFRVGFLGLLHAEIIKEKLKQEEGVNPILTMPRVLYENDENGNLLEPYMDLNVYTPQVYTGGIMTLCQKRKGNLKNVSYHEGNAVLNYEMPYSMFIRGLASEIKTVSSGFASIDYELTDYRKADLEKLDVSINGYDVDVLSDLVYKDEAPYVAREKAEKLKEILPKQQFKQIIQAKIGATILARTEISPFRKDVLQKMSGGDRTRKDKLLEKQKKGKSRLLTNAKVILPEDALISLISRD